MSGVETPEAEQSEPSASYPSYPSLRDRLASHSDQARLPAAFKPGQQSRNFAVALPAAGQPAVIALSFLAHTLWVDNWSSQWVYLANLGHFVPPNVGAWLMPVPDGTETLLLVNAAPQGIAQPASTLATALYITAYERMYLPPMASPVGG